MPLKRYLTEIGMGVDVHGKNNTKASIRAVSDAIRHSSINFFDTLGKSPDQMQITVKIGVPEPELVNKYEVAQVLPYGTVNVETTKGGLEIPSEAGKDSIYVANAAVIVCFEE
ncbi:MAG: hypothetical protein CMM30_01675 [Rhodospirillaceae bacterium]|jgi:uncharacterized protein (TIGR02058 family)|nr:hypothetical protein [Rhodospirillaceae bacterium]|tara:strand:- start:496 stop:834 length:339 start_codon:yes stop_codon:yes gene_type:complete